MGDGRSLSQVLREERQRLDADVASHRREVAVHFERVEAFEKEAAHWRAREATQNERDAQQARFGAELVARSKELDEKERLLTDPEANALLLRLKARAEVVEAKNIALSAQEADLGERQRRLAQDELNYKIKMHRLKQIVEEYFGA